MHLKLCTFDHFPNFTSGGPQRCLEAIRAVSTVRVVRGPTRQTIYALACGAADSGSGTERENLAADSKVSVIEQTGPSWLGNF
jgi:hypothetical protein